MNKRIVRSCLLLSAAMAVVFGMSSCKEDIIIQSNITPAGDNINDTLIHIPDSFFTASTIFDDSVITGSTNPSGFTIFHALGWVNGDTYSGRIAASSLFQVVPTALGFKIPVTDTIQSAYIVLPYGGFTWGDTTTISTCNITAYEINDSLSKDSTYYSFTQKNKFSTPIGNVLMQMGPTGSNSVSDSVTVNGVKVAPHLRIPVNASFLTRIQTLLAADTTYPGFLQAFKGIYLAPDTNTNGVAMPYFYMNGPIGNYSQPNILFYARHNGKDTTYTLPYNTTYAGHFNRITRNYTHPDALNTFAAGSPWLMVQNAPGAAIDLKIKLTTLPVPANSLLNKVEIIFTKKKDDAASLKYFQPARIYPIGIDAASARYGILDRYPLTTDDGLRFIDGTPRAVAPDTIRYTLNIPRELQQAIVQKKTELHLRIGGTSNYPAAYRLLVGSFTNPDPAYRPKVNLIYSKR